MTCALISRPAAAKGIAHVMKELEILTSCTHPFVIDLHSSFQTSKWLCHLMEYCSRGNFYTFVQQQPEKRISEEAGRFYIAEILSGIEYLHVQVMCMTAARA